MTQSPSTRPYLLKVPQPQHSQTGTNLWHMNPWKTSHIHIQTLPRGFCIFNTVLPVASGLSEIVRPERRKERVKQTEKWKGVQAGRHRLFGNFWSIFASALVLLCSSWLYHVSASDSSPVKWGVRFPLIFFQLQMLLSLQWGYVLISPL